MALAVVTSGGNYVSAGTSLTVGPLNVPAGSLIVVDIQAYYGLGLFQDLNDTAGNTFATAYSISVGDAVDSHQTAIELYCANCLGNASNTFTINLDSSGYAVAAVTVISGADTTSPLDKVATDATQFTTSPSITSAATTQADEIVIGTFGQAYNPSLTLTQSSGYTTQYDNFSSGANQTLTVGTKIVSATGTQTYAPSMSGAGPSYVNIAISTYKAASGGGGGSTSPRTMTTMGAGH